MLPPLIAAAVARGGVIRTIVLAPSAAGGDLRLETEVIRLQQEFASKPSRVRFTLRATLVDEATHQVVTTKEFESTVVAAADGPYAGVVAANSAVGSALEALAAFCNEAAGTWRRSRSNAAMPLEGSSLGR
jgi:cholesterol transport system auxiliary component